MFGSEGLALEFIQNICGDAEPPEAPHTDHLLHVVEERLSLCHLMWFEVDRTSQFNPTEPDQVTRRCQLHLGMVLAPKSSSRSCGI